MIKLQINNSTHEILHVPEINMETVKLVRNPYPVPELSREGTWFAGGPILGENVFPDERRWYSKVKPHERLFSHQTLTSARRDCRYRSKEVSLSFNKFLICGNALPSIENFV